MDKLKRDNSNHSGKTSKTDGLLSTPGSTSHNNRIGWYYAAATGAPDKPTLWIETLSDILYAVREADDSWKMPTAVMRHHFHGWGDHSLSPGGGNLQRHVTGRCMREVPPLVFHLTSMGKAHDSST